MEMLPKWTLFGRKPCAGFGQAKLIVPHHFLCTDQALLTVLIFYQPCGVSLSMNRPKNRSGFFHALLYTALLSLTACNDGDGSPDNPDAGNDPTGSGNGNGSGSPGGVQRIRLMHYDFDNNGTPEGRAEASYDSDGFLMSIDYRYRDDGMPDTDFRTFSLGFGAEDRTEDYDYDDEGRIISLAQTTSSSRINNIYTWNDENLITDYTIEIYDSSGGLQNTVRFDLTYESGRLARWNEEFELTGSGATPLAEGEITYDAMTGLPSMLSRETSGGSTEDTALTFNAGGQIDSIITTSPDIPGFESSVQFSYADQGNANADAGDILERRALPDDPADNYSWVFTYDGGLLREHLIDMGSDGTHEAVIVSEWEDGTCRQSFIWGPRAEPDFIAEGNEPYIPGTGYARLDYCDTRDSTL